jgi:hypothetical protein
MAWSAVQDPTGTMYFGCDTVVDGDRWRSQPMDPTYVRGLDVGPNGRIWAAGVNQIGWFEPGAGGRLRYHSLMSRLPDGAGDLGDVWRVYAEGNDSAVFVAREKVLRWDGRRLHSWDYPGMRLLWSTRTSTSVYVHYPPLGLLRIGADGPSLAVPASVIGAAEIRWLDDSAGEWLLLTSDGFKTLRNAVCTPSTRTPRRSSGRTRRHPLRASMAACSPSAPSREASPSLTGRGNPPRVQSARRASREPDLLGVSGPRRGALGDGAIIHRPVGDRLGRRRLQPAKRIPAGGCESLAGFSGATFAISHSDMLRLSTDAESGGAGQFTGRGHKQPLLQPALRPGRDRGRDIRTASDCGPRTA